MRTLNVVRVVLSISLLLALRMPASAQANFGGQWERIEGLADRPLFSGGRIEQNAETVVLTADPPNRLFQEPWVFRLDGTETRYTHGNTRGDETWTVDSRARWIGTTLQITTMTTRSGTVSGSWGAVMTISVDKEGRLVIERNEPTLQGTNTTLRTIYRRK